jgi:probable addiction module antidote protein
MSEQFSRWDSADYLSRALGCVAKAQGMAEVAKASGLTRERLERALPGEGRPRFGTILRVCKALGVKLVAQPLTASHA